MNFRIIPAALAGLLFLASVPPAPASAQDAPPPTPAPAPAPDPGAKDEPDVGPPAPLPAEPKDALKKSIQAILKRWFDDEPSLLEKRNESEIKADRARAAGELMKAIQEWNNSVVPGQCLRLLPWWKARLDETQPSENHGSGIHREEYASRAGKATYIVSLPSSYRGKGPEVYPLILTVLDKEADPKRVLPAIYGKLLETHIVVAGIESNLKAAHQLLSALLYANFTYRIDRDRVVLDAVGKGARFVEDLATSEIGAPQWNGVVFRSPTMTSPLVGNLGLFPCAVLEPSAPTGPVAAAILTIKTQTATEVIPAPTQADEGALQKVRDWIAALPPRRISDQKNSYTMWFRSNLNHGWGFWYVVSQAVEGPPDQPTVRVKISRDPKHNRVDLESVNLAGGTLLLNDEVLDLDRPIEVRVNGIVVSRENVARNAMLTFDAIGGWATTNFGPRNYFVTGVVPFVVEGDARILQADREAAERAILDAQEKQKQEAERKKKEEEEARNPKPSPGPDASSPPPGGPGTAPGPTDPTKGTTPTWEPDYARGLDAARKEGKPLLVLFADKVHLRMKAVDDALGTDEVKAVLLRYSCVRLETEGDVGKEARERLEKVSGSKEAVAPFLALLEAADEKVKGTLAAALLKDEEVAPKVKAFLGPPTPPVPEVGWLAKYGDAVAEALKSRRPLVAFYMAGPEAKGQKGLQEALEKDPEVRTLLSRAVTLRLMAAGEDAAAKESLDTLKAHVKDGSPPVLVGLLFTDEKTAQVLGTIDPVNVPEAELLPRIRKTLAEWVPQQAPPPEAPGDRPKEGEKPGEKKDAPPAPAPAPAPPAPAPPAPAPEEKKDAPPGGTPPKPDNPPKPPDDPPKGS